MNPTEHTAKTPSTKTGPFATLRALLHRAKGTGAPSISAAPGSGAPIPRSLTPHPAAEQAHLLASAAPRRCEARASGLLGRAALALAPLLVFGVFAIGAAPASAATTFSINVTNTGAGTGIVLQTEGAEFPDSIQCGDGQSQCTAEFPEDHLLTLEAQPEVGIDFTGWTVNGNTSTCPLNDTDTCHLTLTEDTEVKANFEPRHFANPRLYKPDVKLDEVQGAGKGDAIAIDQSTGGLYLTNEWLNPYFSFPPATSPISSPPANLANPPLLPMESGASTASPSTP